MRDSSFPIVLGMEVARRLLCKSKYLPQPSHHDTSTKMGFASTPQPACTVPTYTTSMVTGHEHASCTNSLLRQHD